MSYVLYNATVVSVFVLSLSNCPCTSSNCCIGVRALSHCPCNCCIGVRALSHCPCNSSVVSVSVLSLCLSDSQSPSSLSVLPRLPTPILITRTVQSSLRLPFRLPCLHRFKPCIGPRSCKGGGPWRRRRAKQAHRERRARAAAAAASAASEARRARRVRRARRRALNAVVAIVTVCAKQLVRRVRRHVR